MTRLAIQIDVPEPPEPLRNLATHFRAINAAVSGVNVQCSICKTRDRANSKLVRKGERFVCGQCLRDRA